MNSTTAQVGVDHRAFEVLDPHEQDRAAAFRVDADRHSYIAAHGLLRHLLSEVLRHVPGCLPPNRWRFTPATHGKPELTQDQIACNVRFNLSHARGMVAVVVAIGVDVGIDVEAIDRRLSDDSAIADAYFSPSERAYLQAYEDPQRRKFAFMELWTAKEAFIKAMGLGLSMPLDSFCVDLPGSCYAPDSLPMEARDRRWTLRQWNQSTHLVSLAIGSNHGLDLPQVDHRLVSGMP